MKAAGRVVEQDAGTSPATTRVQFRPAPQHTTARQTPNELPVIRPLIRPSVRGKFLCVGDEKFYVRGVTYGPFKPGPDGSEYGDRSTVRRDFRSIAAMGGNALRTYTVPPRWLLDLAGESGLRVMVGLPWEQHVTFLDDAERARSIEQRVREGVRACAGHDAILCYAIGNEIPAAVVRWHGHRALERFLERLYRAVKAEDATALVTYVNFPTTEYLRPRTDFACFNVYLEAQEKLSAYIARLHNLTGDRPLVMAEIGLDSQRNGLDKQASVMSWQIETAFTEGCAGAFAFAWTDEWHRGGSEITDWAFGLTDRGRQPKPALRAVSRAFAEAPHLNGRVLPRFSVVVCTHNGSRTLRECLTAATSLQYPDYEVIVIDDGSTDASAAIASEFPVRVISTPNQGLSQARNAGMQAATGTYIAYLDDDAAPDPEWLQYLARAFYSGDYAAVGGPNIPPPDESLVARCVAHAPGGPVHVLLSDRVAEHIPGCNMAFDRQRLLDIGGFDAQFRVAGDDVDACWRIQARGWTIGFSPSAMVWHRRRSSVKAYLRQQRSYGRAEALLERKWPEKYNAAGHVAWGGRIYAPYLMRLSRRSGRIYHGTWGTALFQSVYEPAPSLSASMMQMPEWYLLMFVLTLLTTLGMSWPPLLAAAPFLLLGVGASVVLAARRGATGWHDDIAPARKVRVQRALIASALHLLQPIARLIGRVQWGLTPWRWLPSAFAFPTQRETRVWHEGWEEPAQRVAALESVLRRERATIVRGSDFDPWDLEIRGGILGGARLQVVVEEHGGGRQLMRTRVRPRLSLAALVIAPVLTALSLLAWSESAALAAAALATAGVGLMARLLYESGGAVALALTAAGEELHDSAVPQGPQTELATQSLP